MAIFFTSDSHFGHRNIIDYCDRPYRTLDGHPDVRAMDADLIKQWNEVVPPCGITYMLGDFGFGPPAKLLDIRKQLNGKIVLIKGNHDKQVKRWLLETDEVHPNLMMGTAFLNHVPPSNDAKYIASSRVKVPDEATLVICGHVHEKWGNSTFVQDGRIRCIYNVGVDIYHYRPIPLEAIPGLEEAWKG